MSWSWRPKYLQSKSADDSISINWACIDWLDWNFAVLNMILFCYSIVIKFGQKSDIKWEWHNCSSIFSEKSVPHTSPSVQDWSPLYLCVLRIYWELNTESIVYFDHFPARGGRHHISLCMCGRAGRGYLYPLEKLNLFSEFCGSWQLFDKALHWLVAVR